MGYFLFFLIALIAWGVERLKGPHGPQVSSGVMSTSGRGPHRAGTDA